MKANDVADAVQDATRTAANSVTLARAPEGFSCVSTGFWFNQTARLSALPSSTTSLAGSFAVNVR